MIVTVAARGSTAPRALQELGLAAKLLLLRQASHRGAVLLPRQRNLGPPYCYLWHHKLLYGCFEALPAVERSLVIIALLAHLSSAYTHSSTVQLRRKIECQYPVPILRSRTSVGM